MNTGAREEFDEPVWARPDAFPESLPGHGWVDPRGKRHPVESYEDLLKAVATDVRGRVMLVWSPRQSRMILPEDLEGAAAAVGEGRQLRAEAERCTTCRRLGWMSVAMMLLAAHQLWQAWTLQPSGQDMPQRLLSCIREILASMPLGLGLLLWLVLGFIPCYQARKRHLELQRDGDRAVELLLPTLRFETWMDFQPAPLTRIIAGAMLLVWLCQALAGPETIQAAGLVKSAYRDGEWWRLLTAPWLHGNLVHFLLNLLALLYLGKRVELFARWPHLLTVLCLASLAGGMLSVRFLDASSVGISGGLMGWLGFLLVFESLHRRLVTRSATRRLLAGVLLTAVIGVVGYRYIDNAAHAGGLVAGMIYGLIVFPGSGSIHRPKVLGIDFVAGLAAAALLAWGLLLTLLRVWAL